MDNKKKETILFVDDEESILDITSEYFQQKGYQVITAKNGFEAVSILEREKIDCCFSDINMPEMDGLELAEHIRKIDNTIPVIIMTGFPSLDNTIRTLKNGVVDFLVKPVNLNQMELCLRRVLQQRELFIENILLKQEINRKKELERLNRELRYKVGELQTLAKIMTEFPEISKSSDVFDRLVAMTTEIVYADESKFYVINEDMPAPFEVTVSSVSRFGLEDNTGLKKRTEKLIMEVVSDNASLLIPENKGILPWEIRSFMAVPLSIRGKVFGVLTASVYTGHTHFSEKSLYYLSFMTNKAAYAIENLALYENIYENLFSTLDTLVQTIEARDPYTKRHSEQVAAIAVTIGKEMCCSTEEIDILNVAGRLHDIGKIGIKDEILLKPGMLTRDEFEQIKAHPVIGGDIVKQLGLWDREQQIIRHHHEYFDGTGYPEGLKADDIPFLARILSVADVYDAMSADRIYRKKMKESKILKMIEEGSGTQFDPDVVDVFKKLHTEGIFNGRGERI